MRERGKLSNQHYQSLGLTLRLQREWNDAAGPTRPPLHRVTFTLKRSRPMYRGLNADNGISRYHRDDADAIIQKFCALLIST